MTGAELAAKFSRSTGCPIAYARFPDSLLEQNALLGGLARLIDEGRLAGKADRELLRKEFPGLLTMDAWLADRGASVLCAAVDNAAKLPFGNDPVKQG